MPMYPDGIGNIRNSLRNPLGAAATYLPTLSVPYGAVFGLTKLISTYGGPLAAACALADTSTTPTTTVDISANSDGTPNFSAAIAVFGNSFAIWKAYDQTGSGNHAVQTVTSTNRPTVLTTLLGKAAFYPKSDGGADAQVNGYLDFPNLSTTRQAATMVAMLSGVNGGESGAYNTALALGNADVSAGASMILAGSGAAGDGGLGVRGSAEQRTALMISNDPTFTAVVFSASATKVWRNSDSTSLAAASSVAMTGGRVGAGL